LDKFLNFVNPLKLKKANVVLVHKAEVESSRLSRTSGPMSEQLRVFVREGSVLLASLDDDAGDGAAATDRALVGGDVDDAVVLAPRINDEVEERCR
jgi:hypothetical protein